MPTRPAFGVRWPPAAQRIEALGEAAQMMRILWDGGGSFSGRWYQLPDAPAYRGTARAEGLPTLIGGHGSRLLLTAARHADLCNLGLTWLPKSGVGWGRCWRCTHARRGACRGPPVLTHNATVLLRGDEAEFSRLVSAWASRRGLSEESARQKLEHSLAGTPWQVCERLRALGAAGVTWVFLLFDNARDLGGLRLFAEAVMPGL